MALGKTARKHIKPHPSFVDLLTPSQSQIMARFLKTLLWAGNEAIETGIRPNVGYFIKLWRREGSKPNAPNLAKRQAISR